MITFGQHLTEVAASKREGIVHLEKLKPLDFIETLLQWKNEFGTILTREALDLRLKVDGAGFRIGKDENGKFFVESSRSGPIFNSSGFSSYVKKNGGEGEKLQRAYLYDDIFRTLEQSKLAEAIPTNVKIVCEMMFNPMGQDLGKTIRFVTIEYDKAKLGSKMTVVLFDAVNSTTGKDIPAKALFEKLVQASSTEIKVLGNKLGFDSLDIGYVVSDVMKAIESFPDYKMLLKSRKAVDQLRKQMLADIIAKARSMLVSSVNNMKIVGRDMLGPEDEGLVLNIGGRFYKIQSDAYKRSKFS